jgi:F-box/TPR repeat protein Pof3
MTSDGLMPRSKLRKLAVIGAIADNDKLAEILQHERLLDLEMLSLAVCHGCDDESVSNITRLLPRLTTLDLSETDITGVGVKQALQLKNLRKLIVNDCRRIGTDAIDWARSQGVKVEYRMCDNLSGGNKIRY